jgi:hypothetical protein
MVLCSDVEGQYMWWIMIRIGKQCLVCTVNYWVQTLISNTPGNFVYIILHLLKYKGGSDVMFVGYIMGAFACGSDTFPSGLRI